MIIFGREIEQVVDRGARRRFHKEILVSPGAIPLAMVRKRRAGVDGTLGTVLLVHGFGQNRYAWHLPSRSLANHLAHVGYDVFNLDLRGHGRSRQLGAPRCRSVEDYVREDLPSAIQEIQAHAGPRPVFLVGHSLGGVVSYAAAPHLAGAVAGIASIGSAYHFTEGSLSLSMVGAFFRALRSAGVPLGNPPIAVRSIGSVLSTIHRFAESPLYPIPLRGWHRGALEPNVLEEHLRLAFDVAGLAEMAALFQWATEGRIFGHGHDAADRFEGLDLPLLVVAGSNDDLAPPASVRPAYERSGSRDRTYRTFPLGHIDLLVGREAPFTTWPLLRRWLDERSGAAGAARPRAA